MLGCYDSSGDEEPEGTNIDKPKMNPSVTLKSDQRAVKKRDLTASERLVVNEFKQFFVARDGGASFGDHLRNHPDFDNPSLIGSMIESLHVDEYASNIQVTNGKHS